MIKSTDYNQLTFLQSISPGYVKTNLQAVAGIGHPPVPPLQPVDIADAVIYALSTAPHVNVCKQTFNYLKLIYKFNWSNQQSSFNKIIFFQVSELIVRAVGS